MKQLSTKVDAFGRNRSFSRFLLIVGAPAKSLNIKLLAQTSIDDTEVTHEETILKDKGETIKGNTRN